MMFYFHGDDFDPGGRGERSRDILDQRRLGYVVVDQPPALTGHWAAGTPLFAERYGACILAFLRGGPADADAQCGGALWAMASRSIADAPARPLQASMR
jgi:hypothetical protein